MPDSVWYEYHIDQEINDRGIMLDMDVVENAIAFDEKSKSSLMYKCQLYVRTPPYDLLKSEGILPVIEQED